MHAKLFEDVYSECYLTAEHFINRIFTESLNWDSFLIRMQKLTNSNELIRYELNHFRVFGCKAYSLLKGANALPKTKKMKSRAFIDYLIKYDSTNIYRI